MEKSDRITIIYDYECPFCSLYVQVISLERTFKSVVLISARDKDNPAIKDLIQQGYDLNEGMVVQYGGQNYFGSDAMMMLSAFSCKNSILAKSLSLLMRHPARAKFFYPFFKTGRTIILKLLRKPPIKS